MQDQLNLVQVFLAAKAFISKEFFVQYSDDLAAFLGSFAINKSKKNWQHEPETWDPAAWDDWMKAVNHVLEPEIASSKDSLVSALQGYRIMQKYIQDYGHKLDYADVIALSQKLDDTGNESFQESKLWKNWLLCIEAMLDDKLSMSGILLSLDTLITQEKAFEIMQQFLKDYCSKANDMQDMAWFEHVQHVNITENSTDAVLNDWFASYHIFAKDYSNQLDITVLQAFNGMRIFVDKQQKNMNSKDLGILLKALQVDKDQRPREYSIEYAWLHAAYAVVFK